MRTKDFQPPRVVSPFRADNTHLALFLLLTLVLAGCGGSASNGSSGSSGSVDHSNDAQLNGMYVFSIGGSPMGSLRADGNGHITGGVEDFYDSNGNDIFSTLTGTYNIGSDGRGAITLNSSGVPLTVDLLMLSSQHGLLLEFESATEVQGSIDMQNPAAFSLPALAVNSYVFELGTAPRGQATSVSAGFFSINTSGVIVSGLEDFLGCCPPPSFALSGSIGNVAANGRASAALTTNGGTLNFAVYVVDSTHLMFFAINKGVNGGGDAFSRQASFDNSSVPGHLVSLGFVVNTDSAGHVTGGTADLFKFQLASNKPLQITTVSVTGNYSVASNGRGTFSLFDPANNLVESSIIYPFTGGLLMLEPSSLRMAFQQQASPFSNASINGNFGETEMGATNSFDPLDFGSLGRIVSDGKGNLSGIQDQEGPGKLTPTFGVSVTGTYSLAANGRGTAMLGGNTFLIYAVNSSRVLFISTTISISSGFWAQQQ